MKKIALFLALFVVVMGSCSKMERNEKKYVKGMQSEDIETSTAAFNDFCQWMQKDQETMTYDFPLMKKEFGMKVVSSPDSLVRCYSWVTNNNGKEVFYASIIQWLVGKAFVAYSGPLDFVLANRKTDLKNYSSFAHSIDTIFMISKANVPVYLIAQSYYDDGVRRAYVSASRINGVKLSLVPFFFDGMEVAGNADFVDNGKVSIGDLFKWDDKAGKFYAYQTDDDNHIIPGKYTIYVLGENRFSRLPDE